MIGRSSSDPAMLVLAGGDGTRLQPLTRLIAGRPIPKQFCRLFGKRSLLEATLTRIAPLAPARRTFAVVTQHHVPLAVAQTTALPPTNLLVQPTNRDTGPGVTFALLALARRHPRARVVLFPSDHFVRHEGLFREAVVRALRVVTNDPRKLALIGIAPERADPGLGYVEPAAALDDDTVRPAFHVAGFREKPSARAAECLVRRGGLWSSFVMAFELRRVLELIGRRRPDDLEALARAATRPVAAVTAAYEAIAPWSFSRDFLARIPEHLVVVRADGTGWSDWGTPEAVLRTLASHGHRPPWAGAVARNASA